MGWKPLCSCECFSLVSIARIGFVSNHERRRLVLMFLRVESLVLVLRQNRLLGSCFDPCLLTHWKLSVISHPRRLGFCSYSCKMIDGNQCLPYPYPTWPFSGLCVRGQVLMPDDVKGKTLKREVALSSFQGLLSLRKRVFDLAQPCLAINRAEMRGNVNLGRDSMRFHALYLAKNTLCNADK